MDKDRIETLLDILVEDNGFTGCAVFGMQEADVTLALQAAMGLDRQR